jgi:hypothetical protein
MLNNKQIIANQKAIGFTLQLEDYVKNNIYPDFTCTIKLDWSPRRSSSRGGIYSDGPGVNIAMNTAALVNHNTDDVYRFYEYPSYDADKVIGGFYAKNYELKLKAIIAHEVSHAVQFFEYKKLNIRCKPHGDVFKKYYKLFRTTFVNNMLPEQSYLKTAYEDSLKQLNITLFTYLR